MQWFNIRFLIYLHACNKRKTLIFQREVSTCQILVRPDLENSMTRGFSIFPRGSAVYLRHDDCNRANVHEYETISTYHSQETKRFVLLG